MSDHAVPIAAKPAVAKQRTPASSAGKGARTGTRPGLAEVAQRAGNGAAAAVADGARGLPGGLDANDPTAMLPLTDPLRAAQLDRQAQIVLDVEVTAARRKVLDHLRHSLGVGGAGFYRSEEVRAFRQRMKDAARARAAEDIALLSGSVSEGPATKQYLDLIARGEAYGLAKESVDEQLSVDAEGWMQQHWDAENDTFEAAQLPAIKRAMWSVLEAAPDNDKRVAKAQQIGRSLAKKAAASRATTAQAAAGRWKNAFIKPDVEDDGEVADAEMMQSALANEVAARTTGSGVGERALKASIAANSTAEGLNIIGRMLDKVIPQPGDNVSLSVELTIPIPSSPAFVTLKVEGKAGRGTTGFTTAGFASAGNPHRLEIMSQFSVGAGVGAKLLGLDVSVGGSIGFFVRSGADEGTKAAMTALSYGAYRAATGLSRQFGNWWAGSGAGVDEGKTQRSEIWAAMVEERVFDRDSSAFADLGGSLGVAATAKGKVDGLGGMEAEAALAAEVFRRYDKEGLAPSLGDAFAQPVASKDDARKRRQNAAGRTVTSFGVSAELAAELGGQAVTFEASFSGEKAGGEDNGFWKNWGVAIGVGLSLPPGGDSSLVDDMVAGLVAGVLSSAQNIGRIVQKGSKEGGGGDIAMGSVDTVSDITRILDSGFKSQLSTSLNEVWTSGPEGAGVLSTESSLKAVVTFGRTGGDWNARFEVVEAKSLSMDLDAGNVGVKAEATRGKRVFAWGYEHKEDPNDPDETVGVWKLEAAGLRFDRGGVKG